MAVQFSQIARAGGDLTWSFPGDMVGHIHRNGGKSSALNGWREWKYGYQYGSSLKWFNTNYYQGHHYFFNSNWASVPFINSRGEVHPARHGSTNYVNIIRWRAPHSGRVRMFGTMFDSNLGGGNGVNMWCAKMSFKGDGVATSGTIREWVLKQLNSRTLGGGSATFNKSINVSAGDIFYMAVGPDSEHSYDTTVCKWNIYYEHVNNWAGTNISLRRSMEDAARYNAFLPNYYPNSGNKHGQDAWNKTKFSDRGTSSNVQISDFINSTWLPDLIRTSSGHDTNLYGSAGNGSLSVDLAFGPDGAQWWGTGTNVKTTHYLYNVSPPSVVASKIKANGWLETANQTGNRWYGGTSSNPVGGGSTGQASWTRLVGGLYGVDTTIDYVINGQRVVWHIDDNKTHAKGRVYIQRGLRAYAYGGYANK